MEKVLTVVLGLLIGCLVCVATFNLGRKILTTDDKARYTLSAEDASKVSAVYVATDEGYTVTSAVCEVVSSERFLPWVNLDGGQIVFYAFRITKPSLNSDDVVLFSSNLTAEQGGSIWVFTINDRAHSFFPDFPYGPELEYPININTDGAQTALDCAQHAGSPPR